MYQISSMERYQQLKYVKYTLTMTFLIACALSMRTLQMVAMFGEIPFGGENEARREIPRPSEPLWGETKEELVQSFLERYDLDWNAKVKATPKELLSNWFSCRQVHADQEPQLGGVLNWLATARIVRAQGGVSGYLDFAVDTGHSTNFRFEFEDGTKAIFKPKAYSRTQRFGGFVKGKMGFDRHNGEIAAYHLQRVLGFNRAPLAVGRKIDLEKELLPVAQDKLLRWQKKGLNDQMCLKLTFRVHMRLVKTREVCTEDGLIEGALIVWLPHEFDSAHLNNPSRKGDRDILDPSANKLVGPIARETTKLLDYIDGLVLDHLVQNPDRHTLDYLNASACAIWLIDNGKTFGDPIKDYPTVLEILQFRCEFRKSTYLRLKQLQDGVLGEVLRHILSRDPIAPVLWDKHYEALDRRLIQLLGLIDECVDKHGARDVLLEDDWSAAQDWRPNMDLG